ncbi:unnamed protein product, partial [Rotaria sp. Silwood2]
TKIHSICVQQQDFEKLAKSMLEDYDRDISHLRAVRHGILNEELCRRRYVLEQAKMYHTEQHKSPPVYSNVNIASRSTPYPTNESSMPMPTPMGTGVTTGGNSSYSYPYGYPQTQIPQDIY